MANKMLIDADHPEETRVVVVRGNRVEEFDFESEDRKQLRGNIYLAKVTRVEPSLQAAFVDYGGNRHGFLAFSEIHPDYYQIPVADRQALIEEEERASAEEAAAELDAENLETAESPDTDADANSETDTSDNVEAVAADADAPEVVSEPGEAVADDATDDAVIEARDESADDDNDDVDGDDSDADEDGDDSDDANGSDDADSGVESAGAEDALEEVPVRRRTRMRQYKIQEVIKRRQILLVQVVKEERGNKGAALTTYLSLAGRYSVLMPNTARGGGISRKITNVSDRKRLKQVVSDLDMPEGMGVILRTAGASRTKSEVKRDFEYLLRLWESVRELTLSSTAPSLVYEEGSLIKRSIRDLYNKEINEVVVAGDAAYKEAKGFMRMLMPSHAKNVKAYKDPQPLLAGSGIETQLDAMFSPQVTLKSGGYIVINQTEALVSVDVNSGRSTREHNIEDTALQTNLEAADEVARQLRLRDLAGLIVIDFIDMDEKRNNRAVERRMKEALKHDRARIQVGRISPFGLMEMSRQRLRTGVLESTTTVCAHCQGTGYVRSPASVALHVLRSLEDHLLKNSGHNVTVRTRTQAALYILNNKRAHLAELEQRFGIAVLIDADESIADGSHFAIERGEKVERRRPAITSVQPDSVAPELDDDEDEAVAVEAISDGDEAEQAEESTGRKRRRRRRRRGGSGGEAGAEAREAQSDSEESGDEQASESAEASADSADGDEDQPAPRRRRRGRRGGRRNRRSNEAGSEAAASEGATSEETEAASGDDSAATSAETDASVPAEEPATQPVNGHDAAPAREDGVEAPPPAAPVAEAETPAAEADDTASAEEPTVAADDAEVAPSAAAETEAEPKRRGWWQRRSFF